MLDLKFIRENPDIVEASLKHRRADISLSRLLDADRQWRYTQTEADKLRNYQNNVSKEIAELKRSNQNASDKIAEMKNISQKIKEFNNQAQSLKAEIDKTLMEIPNIPHETTPIGSSESDNPEIKRWGKQPNFDFEPKPHWEIAEALDIVDFRRGSKIAGNNFLLYKGIGAKLERALINFMLDLHTNQHGYTEISPPFVANRPTMTGTGQLPKFESDMYRCDQDQENPENDLFLIPTAEVPITNIFANELLSGANLPINYTAYTPCFRREAGSYGRETRGMIRLHQFDKVEMVKFTPPETSYDEHESLLTNVEAVVQALSLPYRVITLCTADLGFSASKCYDVEVWTAGEERFLEISSCSNFEDFQARRANIRFRRESGAKPEFVHTLNASGLALPRVVIAILENYQYADGSVGIPQVLKPYMGGLDRIESLAS
ncbi:MAG: serine--tRNA ligase [Candidatus Poribacteria bacterium]|nr:serine--tRNA ligase [Candidatus Poribacteria bacterium]